MLAHALFALATPVAVALAIQIARLVDVISADIASQMLEFMPLAGASVAYGVLAYIEPMNRELHSLLASFAAVEATTKLGIPTAILLALIALANFHQNGLPSTGTSHPPIVQALLAASEPALCTVRPDGIAVSLVVEKRSRGKTTIIVEHNNHSMGCWIKFSPKIETTFTGARMRKKIRRTVKA